MTSTTNRRLEGKVALITGTGGGQGRAAALRFAREGATVVGCDLHADSHLETRRLLEAEGLQLHGDGSVDLGDVDQARAWVEDAARQFERIDILYNNASATRFGPMAEFSVDDWHYVIRNELDLVFYTTRYAWQYLARQGGTIINIASTAAWCGSTLTGKAAHSAAKGAVVSFTRQLAVEGAPVGIRAISISPGFIKTPGTAAFVENPETRAKLLKGVLLDRPGESEEVAALAAFVASGEATYITGTDLVIDGGLLAT
ncbi:MAG: SDR family oxidoreductase [Gammaproteobacteria bacterium]|uniref:SDR family NAD(P)-dependent oxidoreductase n=1 Tax=Pseudomaricurvus alcaniphilus TaxID=1166482 RepID=UPI001408470E|nr:SDR family NAD(P)-dependent oxidoreductase [Pseudomaricurvus alcaniphilus]MBR9909336.1 SDR family oxidoreductase [Gammaproteobacteria bacterium]NHN38272.1 SDR family oxidoreductase [Pseudomaricurvus alcaniphilus]